jgi:hypothetical protein
VDEGKQKLEVTLGKGEVVLPETSAQGQELVREELTMLSNDFDGFDTDLGELNTMLGKRQLYMWRVFESYEGF